MLKDSLKRTVIQLEGTCGVAVCNLNTHEAYLHNDRKIFPAASLIKLFILLEFFRCVDRKELCLDAEVSLQKEHKVPGFGIVKELHAGLNLTYEDLALLMIVLSDNVATNILIDTLGMSTINATTQKQGYVHTSLQRKMMDGEAKSRGLDNYTTPRDILNLLIDIETGKILSASSRQRFIDILKRQQCNNKLPLLLPSEAVLAHKTGDLPQVEHDAGLMYIKDVPIAIVVMTKDLVDNLTGVTFNNLLGKMIYNYFSNTGRIHDGKK
jgi:beta-lactamase class A